MDELNKNTNNKKIILILSIVSTLIILIGSVYAFFTYSKSAQAFTLTSGSISATFTSGSNQINFTNAYPISDSYALENLSRLNYIDFTVDGSTSNEEEAITYEIFLTEANGNTLSSNYIKIYVTDEYGVPVSDPSIYSSLQTTTYPNEPTGKVAIKKTYAGTFTKSYRLYAWLDSSYEQNTESQTFSFYVNIFAYNNTSNNVEKSTSELITQLVANNIVTNSGTTRYITGTSDNNYVWYSGRMWRIVCYDIDANDNISNIKLVTQDVLTTIFYGTNSNFSTSYVKTWLNEDFYDTLINPTDIIQPTTWNDGDANTTVPVGLLSETDYNTVKNGSNANYLNIGYYWWLITKSGSNVRNVVYYNYVDSSSLNYSRGVRPSVYLKSGLTFTGSGTIMEPFMLKGDKATGATGNDLNKRTVGEYVRFKNTLFRIVGIENNNTKLVSVDYANINGTYFEKYFASTKTFGLPTNTQDDNYSDYYLNNTWLDSLGLTTEQLRSNYLVKGTYYLGECADGGNYKTTICDSSIEGNLNKKINGTDSCTRVSDIYNSGYVGLLRVGEMFSAPEGSGYGSSKNMWIITPNGSYVRIVSLTSDMVYSRLVTSVSVRPSIYLKSSITITGGSGLKNDPYTVE